MVCQGVTTAGAGELKNLDLWEGSNERGASFGVGSSPPRASAGLFLSMSYQTRGIFKKHKIYRKIYL